MLKKITIPESLIDAYRSHLDLEKILVTRIFCMMSIALVACTVILDRWALPSVVFESNIARVIVIAFHFFIVYSTYKPFFSKYCSLIQGIGCLIPAIALSYIIYLSAPSESGHYIYFGFLVLIIVILFSWSHISTKWSVINSLVIMGVYTLAVYLNSYDKTHNFLEVYVPSMFIMQGSLLIGFVGKCINENHIKQNFLYLQSIKQSEKTQEYYANHDALTGLINRRYSDQLFSKNLDQAKNNDMYNVMMLLDLNRFKEINDKHGHQAGDKLLKIVAKRLRHCIREGDYISRLGGDEFAINIVLENENIEFVDELRRKIEKAVIQPIKFENTELSVGVSIGMAKYPCDADECETLLKIADDRMYQDKKKKKEKSKTDDYQLDSELFQTVDNNTLLA